MRAQADPITPLIDVLFTVVIALAVFVKPDQPEQVEVPTVADSPGAESASDSTPMPLVEVDREGMLRLDGQPVEMNQLVSRIPKAQPGKHQRVRFRAGRDCLYQDVFNARHQLTQLSIDVIEVGEIDRPE
jgi:biopolymer transport protein ExbD